MHDVVKGILDNAACTKGAMVIREETGNQSLLRTRSTFARNWQARRDMPSLDSLVPARIYKQNLTMRCRKCRSS